MRRTHASFILFLLLAVILPASICQRGGGNGGSSSGGRSGGSSSGSSSSGGSSYRGRSTYYSNRYYGGPGYYGGGYGSGQSSLVGTIVGSVFGGLCLCGLAVMACVLCKCCNCKWLPCSKFQQLKRHYNTVDQNLMTEEQYISKRDRIIGLINQSQHAKTFAYDQAGNKSKIQANAAIVKESKLLTEIKLSGNDQYGNWKADGFILPRNGQMFLWFYKEYEDKKAAGQTDKWEHLVFESTRYDDYQGMIGRWFYCGYENSNEYSGQWRLFTQDQSANINQSAPYNAAVPANPDGSRGSMGSNPYGQTDPYFPQSN